MPEQSFLRQHGSKLGANSFKTLQLGDWRMFVEAHLRRFIPFALNRLDLLHEEFDAAQFAPDLALEMIRHGMSIARS